MQNDAHTPQYPPVVSIIVPAYNAASTLETALCALCGQECDAPFEVIVIDDGSRDATAAIAERYKPTVRLVRNSGPRGAGAARNLGVAEARGSILAFTDADCYPTSGWLAAALAAIQDADLVQGSVEPDPAVQRTPFDRTLVVERDRGFYQTANLVMRREVFEVTGGFRDWALEREGWWRRSLDGPSGRAAHRPVGEDTLLGWTAFRNGARSAFAPDARVHHAVFPGGVRDDMADRWQWSRDMPGLVALVPELRENLFYRRWFFNHWTAQFDLAVAGLAFAALSRRWPWLLAAGPYLWRLGREARRYPRRQALTFVIGMPAVEAVTLAGLLTGSVAWRSLVL